jgi:hypothetical protein
MTGAMPPLPDQLVENETLFRALRTKAEQDDKRRAFLLRANEKDTGLSVKYNCAADDCENELKKSYGVLSVIASQVVQLGLRVVPDEATHANIEDIPHESDDPDRAMLIAGQLSSLALTIREGLRHRSSP